MSHENAPSTELRAAAQPGWELVRILQTSLVSLEFTASRVVAAEVAGLIALWTQLYTFEDGLPRVLAWIAWATFLVAIAVAGVLMRPRRLVRFWDVLLPADSLPPAGALSAEEEARVAARIWQAMRAQRDRLDRSIGLSVLLGVAGLALTAVAYAIEQAWYAP